jgi:hypothetical protein
MHGRRAGIGARPTGRGRLVGDARAREVDEDFSRAQLRSLLASILCRALDLDPISPAMAASVVLTVSTVQSGATSRRRASAPASSASPLAGSRLVEYQSRDDAISFYKFNPVTSRRRDADVAAGDHQSDARSADAASYRRYRWRFCAATSS